MNNHGLQSLLLCFVLHTSGRLLLCRRNKFVLFDSRQLFEAILEELKTTFVEEPHKTLNEKSLKYKESLFSPYSAFLDIFWICYYHYWSTNPYEIRGTTSSSSLHWDGKRSLNRHNIQLLVIYVWAIFVLKMYEISARNFSVKSTICSSQTFYHLISFLSTFYQP